LELLLLCWAFVFCFSNATELTVDFEFAGLAPTCCASPPPKCGDGVCSPGEGCNLTTDQYICRLDCHCGPLCGDEICDAPENCTSCPGDCGECSVCGNDKCENTNATYPIESCITCNIDCGRCKICGDHICELDENCNTCSDDCGTCLSGIVQGQLVDSVSGMPLAGATAQLFIDGVGYGILTTDSSGFFMYNGVPTPYATFKLTAVGYTTAWTQVPVIQGATNRFIRGMSAPLLATEWRVILTWLDIPVDLDLTLFGPYDSEIYYNGVCDWEYVIKNQSVPWAGYSKPDATMSMGPETIKVLQLPQNNTVLEFWVHNYSGDRTDPTQLLRNSTANIWIFNHNGQIGEFSVPRDSPIDSTWWHVFDLNSMGMVGSVNEYFTGHAAGCEFDYCPYAPP